MAGRELILRRADGTVVCGRCKLADHPLARLRGLLGREGLDSGEGLLLKPASSNTVCWTSRTGEWSCIAIRNLGGTPMSPHTAVTRAWLHWRFPSRTFRVRDAFPG